MPDWFALSTMRAKLSVGFVAALTIVVVAVVLLIRSDLNDLFAADASQRLGQVTAILRSYLPEDAAGYAILDDRLVVGDTVLTGNDALASRVSELTGAVVDIWQGDRLVATSHRDAQGRPLMGERLTRTFDGRAALFQRRQDYAATETVGGDMYYAYYEPLIAADGLVIGVIGAHGPKANFDAWVQEILMHVLEVAIPVGILVSVLMLWLTARVFRGFRRIRKTMLRIADDELDVTIPSVGRRDEIGAMARAVERFRDNALLLRELEAKRLLALEEERRQAEEIAYMANHDGLTGLANRRVFMNELDAALAQDELTGSVMFLDLDQFKEVNDTLGHGTGDNLLIAVADRLRAVVPPGALLARLGGDEFAVLERVTAGTPSVGAEVAEAIVKAVAPFYQIDRHRIRLGVSVGLAHFPQDGRDRYQLVRKADLAMYRAKSDGRNRVRIFQDKFESDINDRRELLIDLEGALERGELSVHYQPKISLATGAIAGAEALIRWRHPSRGWVSPAVFIPIAEESGLVTKLGAHVLRTACSDARGWAQSGGKAPHVAVNLSAVQLRDDSVIELVADALACSELPPGQLELEITESAIMDDVESVIGLLGRLRSLGLTLAIDDFGTGYSSLSYLRRFPIDKMKIDRSFIVDMTTSTDALSIARSIQALGRNLGLEIVAEGIETAEQLALLRDLGVEQGQGYLFSKALPAAEFIEFHRTWQGLGNLPTLAAQ